MSPAVLQVRLVERNKYRIAHIVKTVPETYFMGNKAIYIEGFLKNRPALSRDGIIPEGAPAISLRALTSVNPKMASMKVNLEAVYTNEFAKKANAKYFG